MEPKKPRTSADHWLGLHVTNDQYAAFKEQADIYGYDLSSLLRIRIFGKVKKLRLTRRPSYNIQLLGDALGRLIGITSALNQNGSHMSQIAEKLAQGTNDLFGLDGALRKFEQLSLDILKLLNTIEAVIKGRPNSNRHKILPSIKNKRDP